ncbi:hypothetical protein [Bradyrhizobium sp. HKCCYLS20291]|uniref:hypothetical protein n=1 Tax=Bradyrhizobium sp. HKCCYLS20291 TaxID=3420766 RepID=UPI003EBDA0B4
MTIPMPSGTQVWLATGHTDMRKGFDGLALAEESEGTCPSNLDRSGEAYRKRSGKRSRKISAKSCGR